jgi:glycine/D-amino acid oxidase-like deaminating enzyme
MTHQRHLLEEDGITAELLDRQAVQELIHTPLAEEIVGGYLAPTGGTLHSGQYIGGLAQAAQRHGAVLAQAEVASLHVTGNAITVHTSEGPIEAGKVVVALNAWTDTLVPEMEGMIVPTRGQILAYKPSAPVFTTATGADITPTGEYWQQRPDGSIVIGGCREDAPNRDSGVRDMVATPDVVTKISEVLPRLFPDLDNLAVDRSWAGPMAFTPDGLPVVDHIDTSENIWFAGGFNGHGMPFGPVLGRLLAQSVTGDAIAPELVAFAKSRASLG